MPWHVLLLLPGLWALAACSPSPTVSPPGVRAFEVSLATFASELVVAWHGGRAGRDDVYLQWVDASGKPRGNAVQVTESGARAYEPDVQVLGDDALIGWYERRTGQELPAAVLARVGRDGHVRWRHDLSAPGEAGRNTVVRVSGENVFVAWIGNAPDEPPAVWMARFDHEGVRREPPRRIAAASTDTWNLNAAVAGELFYVVYDARLGTHAKELQLLIVLPEEVRQVRLSGDDGHDSVYPDIAVLGERFALTWFDQRDGNAEVYLHAGELTALEAVAAVDEHALRITHTEAPSIGAYLTWSGERIGLVWCDTETDTQQVYLQRFGIHGEALAPRVRLSTAEQRASIPAIRPWRGGFAIAWNEYTAADGVPGHEGILASVARLRFVE